MATALLVTVRYSPGSSHGGAALTSQVIYFPGPEQAAVAMNQLRGKPGISIEMIEDVIVPGGL